MAMNALTRAIKIFGSRRAFAEELGVSGEAVRKWELSRVPAERCRDVVRVVNERQPGALSLSDLREDLWPAITTPAEAA